MFGLGCCKSAVTPVCISTAAALAYYEAEGRTWERAAFIKARAAAGDIAAGERLLREVESKAAGMGLKELFVLTTQTAHWFLEQGFVEAAVEELPEEKQELYNYQRNSKIFEKAL